MRRASPPRSIFNTVGPEYARQWHLNVARASLKTQKRCGECRCSSQRRTCSVECPAQRGIGS
jgi:hypothetical protein